MTEERIVAPRARKAVRLQVDGAVARALEALRRESDRLFGFSARAVEVLHRRERDYSQVLRVSVRGEGRSANAFVKAYPGPAGPVEEEYRATVRAFEAMHGEPGLCAARPLLCLPEEGVLITEEVAGPTLASILRRIGAFQPGRLTVARAALERTGRWLAAFQRAPDSTRRLSLQEMRCYLDERLQILLREPDARFAASWRRSVLRRFDSLASQVRPEELTETALHADFCPENVIVQPGGGIAVIDFSAHARGGRLHDVTYLFACLEILRAKPWVQKAVPDELQRALLRGFDPAVDPRDPLFELFLLQHAICELVVQAARVRGGLRGRIRRALFRGQRRRIEALGLQEEQDTGIRCAG